MPRHTDNPLIGKSEIYMITNNVTGKKYIGQVKCMYGNGKYFVKMGTEGRWKHHVADAKKDIQGRGARCLIHNIQKYGEDNFEVQALLTCSTQDANELEIKMIQQYNTQVPNGMNIMSGGKNAPIAEETKKKMSEAAQGKYAGVKNPMFGKKHKPETVEKIKQALTGVALAEDTKKNMSAAHTKRMEEGKLPPRRKHTDLPKYIYHVTSKDKDGYEIRHHPKLKRKQFVAKTLTMEQKLKQAEDYLKDINNPANQKEKQEFKTYDNLPRYVRHIRQENLEGFEVKFHPKLPNKKWTSKKLTMDQKLQLAKDYLESCSETKSLSVASDQAA